jgi:hypothetical protein
MALLRPLAGIRCRISIYAEYKTPRWDADSSAGIPEVESAAQEKSVISSLSLASCRKDTEKHSKWSITSQAQVASANNG